VLFDDLSRSLDDCIQLCFFDAHYKYRMTAKKASDNGVPKQGREGAAGTQ